MRNFLLGQHESRGKTFAEVERAGGDARKEPCERPIQLRRARKPAESAVARSWCSRSWCFSPTGRPGGRCPHGEEADAKQALSNLEGGGVDGAGFTQQLEEVKRLVLEHARLRRSGGLPGPSPVTDPS